jgi:predicted permease
MRKDWIGRIHGWLRLWLPGDFRRRHGESMEEVFRERLAGERVGAAEAGRIWMREGRDLAATGIRLRLSHGKRGGDGMEAWREDLKSAWRSLRRSSGYAAFAATTLGLGIGATVTFAAFLDRVVLRPVDFPNADRLVMVWRTQEARGLMVSPDREARDRVKEVDAFQAVAAIGGSEVVLSTEQGPRVLEGRTMDQGLPVMAGRPPVLGRYFDADDLKGDGAPVVVLSQGLWKRAFGSDPGVIGSTVRIEGQPRTVVGVAPDALRPPSPGDPPVDVWLPLAENDTDGGLAVYALLRDGVTLEQAREQVKALGLAARENEGTPWSLGLVPAGDMVGSRLKSPLKAVGAAVALLLLIACINAANLLLARGDARRRDTAVRAALGASSARLGRELVLENLLLVVFSSVLGLALADGVVRAVRGLRPEDLRVLDSVHLDPLVTGSALVAAALTALLFGLIPLLHRVRTRPAAVLTERAATSAGDAVAVRRILLVAEVALSFALLASSVQLVNALRELNRRDTGFATAELLAVRFRLPDWRFADSTSREAGLVAIRRAVRSIPGVRDATVASGTPPRTGIYFGQASAEDQPEPEGGNEPSIFFGNSVDPGYFATLGQAVLEGRTYKEQDLRTEPRPWVIGESAARKYFPDGNAVGGRLRLGSGDYHRIIGVVRDIWAMGSATDPGYPQLYLPRDEGEGGILLVRASDPGAVAPRIRTAFRTVDREIPVTEISSVASLYRDALARERLVGMLLTAFAVTAALLATVGLYGVVSQLATRRVREFGIRISLGADRLTIFRLALRGGALAVAAGLGLGSALAWVGLRFLQAGVAGLDAARPGAFVLAGLLLGVATLLAMGLPASRASRTDPVEALRTD